MIILSISELIIAFLLGALVTAYLGIWYNGRLSATYIKVINSKDEDNIGLKLIK